jgi:tetratricopeptide (TPR) repeat protein
MIRPLVVATIFGALAAAGALHAMGERVPRDAMAPLRGASEQVSQAKAAIDDFPICTSMAAIGGEADWSELDPDFAAGKKALAAADWNGAITALSFAALRDPRNADIANYIGYAYRRLAQLGPAMGHYQQALMLNPRHRGAHAHLGELFLALGDVTQAEQHLAALERICLVPCEEFGALERAIAGYRAASAQTAAAR